MLELEITESVVMKDEAWAEQALAQLKESGVMLAIDDFGIGYRVSAGCEISRWTG